jgi:hypothetical protein
VWQNLKYIYRDGATGGLTWSILSVMHTARSTNSQAFGISYYDANADLKSPEGGFVFPPPLPSQIFIPIVIK